MRIRELLFIIFAGTGIGIIISCMLFTIATFYFRPKEPIKKDYETICIGGWQYELIMNEFNEPIECGRD